MQSLPPHCRQYKSETPGPTITIMGGLHGDEPMGVEIISKLKDKLADTPIESGNLTLIIGNPKAVEAKIRPIDKDMNRMFGTELQPTPGSYEEQRIQEIKSILNQSDILLDIHSTSSPAKPFIYCELTPAHLTAINSIDIPYIVSPDPKFRPPEFNSAADNYIDNQGGIGITYETGQRTDISNFNQIYKNVINFLTAQKLFPGQPTKPSTEPKHIIINQHLLGSKDFQFSKQFKNFDEIKTGELIATSNKEKITAQSNKIIIFPKTQITPNKAACYLGTYKNEAAGRNHLAS